MRGEKHTNFCGMLLICVIVVMRKMLCIVDLMWMKYDEGDDGGGLVWSTMVFWLKVEWH